ncbi:MAG: UbiD family decarboxylase [SAR324 cluster bacterium]|nr:UbiD family decarboxylase [SAR324 cluster bacterium]
MGINQKEKQIMGKANWHDMREFMDFCEERGELLRITDEVDPAWEINGLTRIALQDRGPALLFENIKGTNFPMLTNLLGKDNRFLWTFGLDNWEQFNQNWLDKTGTMIPPRILESGPFQEEVIERDDIDLHKICNTVWHQFDGGEFPGTLSISITRDRDTGVLNTGIYRMHTLSKNTLGWGAPEYTHGRQHYMMYERNDEPMPMAVVTGYEPMVLIASSTRTGPGIDEFHIAGGLKGEPLDMVESGADGILVPATSEFVFEGFIKPHHREIEGGFGEYTGFFGEARSNPVFEVTRITHRKKPIYLGAREQWYPSESALVVGKSSQAEAFKTVKSLVPGVLDMRCDVTYECIVKIDKLFPGHPQQVMDAVWGGTYARYKHVIIVDKDIDIWDYDMVHWALSTRVRADRDVTISPRRAGQWLDPAVSLREKGWQTQMGIDATLCNEEYEFWGEKPPRLVDDPEVVAKTLAKWENKISWRK